MNMTMLSQTLKCCGVKEIHAMDEPNFNPSAFFKRLCYVINTYQNPHMGQNKFAGYAHYVLTTAYDRDYDPQKYRNCTAGYRMEAQSLKRIDDLCAYIKKHDLGTVVVSPPAGSPKYGGASMIISMIYTPNNNNIIKLGRKNKWVPAKFPKQPRLHTVWL